MLFAVHFINSFTFSSFLNKSIKLSFIPFFFFKYIAINIVKQIINTINTIEKQTRESITNLNVKPETTNVPQQDDGVMTLDKFYKMTNEEQIKFVNENPEAIQNLQ